VNRFTLYLVAALTILTAAPPAPAFADQCVTLELLTAMALKENPKIQAAYGEHQAMMSEVEVAEAARSFKVGTGIDATSVSGTYGQGSTAPLGPFVRVSKLLWNGGRVDADVKQRELGAATALLDVDVVQNDLAGGLAETYAEVLRQQSLLEAADTFVGEMERVVQRMAGIVDIDRGRRSDLDLARARLSAAESTRSLLRISLQDTLGHMRRYLAHAEGTWETKAQTCFSPPDFSGRMPANLVLALQTLEETNPLLIQGRKHIEMLREQARLERLKSLPSSRLELAARTARDGDGNTDYLGLFELKITGDWEAYDGGAVNSASRAAKQRAVAAQSALNGLQYELDAQVRQYWNQAFERRQRQNSLAENLLHVRAVRNDAEEQFMAGRRSLLDLLNFENDVFNARQLVLNNRADMLVAEIRLLTVLGRLPFPDNKTMVSK